jgi:hypothetical protein
VRCLLSLAIDIVLPAVAWCCCLLLLVVVVVVVMVVAVIVVIVVAYLEFVCVFLLSNKIAALAVKRYHQFMCLCCY